MSRTWDVFCRVVDNYGDAAVCWRLALQLAAEHDAHVRLWIDALPALHDLCPEVDPEKISQQVLGVEVCEWGSAAAFGVPAEIAIEAFGCGLPDSYAEAMAARPSPPVWIILEYLSAEGWVGTHHGMPSPHPRLPLQRHFFFPGFVRGTGGVLCEAALEGRRAAFRSSPSAAALLWERLGFDRPPDASTVVSLFGYENAAAGRFLQTWSEAAEKVTLAVPPSRLRAQVCDFLGAPDAENGRSFDKGALEVRLLPFMPQPLYDQLLWASDWNFVRGEDSFVRAQWARRPLAWHIYPQADDAHRTKLEAFLGLYCENLEPGLADALQGLWRVWNGFESGRPGQLPALWQQLSGAGDALRIHSANWADRLRLPGDLAANLAHFCEERLK